MMPYLVFCGLGLLQSIRDPRTRSLGVLVGLMTIYFWIFSIVFTPLVRYMIPALGLLLLAAPGIGHLNKGIKNGGLSSGQRN
jgi:hypothetical protein